MQNLLPFDEKKKLKKDYASRRMVVFLASLLVVSLVAMIFLTAVYVLVSMQAEATSQEVIAKEADHKEKGGAVANFQVLDKSLSLISKPHAGVPATTVVDEVLKTTTTGILINEFTYDRLSKDGLILRGRARDRATLVSFISRLREHDLFSSVSSPASNLLRERDLEFTITLDINQDFNV